MKTAIIYAKTNGNLKGEREWDGEVTGQYLVLRGQLMIRVEVVDMDVEEALDKAKMEEGETFLNTVALE